MWRNHAKSVFPDVSCGFGYVWQWGILSLWQFNWEKWWFISGFWCTQVAFWWINLKKTWDQDQKGPLIPVIPGIAVQLFRWSEELFFMRSKWKPLRNWNQKQDETLHKTWKACLCPHAKRCVTVWYWTSFSCNVYHTWDVFPHWQLFSVWSETITHLICVSFVESRYDTGMSLQSFLTAMIV